MRARKHYEYGAVQGSSRQGIAVVKPNELCVLFGCLNIALVPSGRITMDVYLILFAFKSSSQEKMPIGRLLIWEIRTYGLANGFTAVKFYSRR